LTKGSKEVLMSQFSLRCCWLCWDMQILLWCLGWLR